MRKTYVIAAFLAASASLLMGVEEAKIETTLLDGKTETKTVKLQRLDDATTRLVIRASDIPANAKDVEVFADSATAKKGDDGFWLMSRGVLGKFDQDKGLYFEWKGSVRLPYFAMKTPKETFIAIIDGMRFEFDVRAVVRNGVYTLSPRWRINEINFKPYEDVSITFITLPKDADYNDMAKVYRRYRMAQNPDIKPMKERMKFQPYLKQLANSFHVRMMIAQKSFDRAKDAIDFTPETEHKVLVRCSFEDAKRLIRKMKVEGMDDVAVCLAGWQTGGYDGRCPSTFPICVEAGGEDKLREFIKAGQDQGFIMDAQSNYTDCYTCSPMWSENIVCKDADGKLLVNGSWSGGKAYDLCLANAWNTFLPSELEKISKLGFRGAHYIDVFSCVRPYSCCDKNHPVNRKEQGEYQRKAADMCHKLFGGFASEGGMEHMIDKLDYINYVSPLMRDQRARPNNLVSSFVPFWELVYHDVVLSNPDRVTQGKLSRDDNLRLVEFGGRPIFYSVSDANMADLKASYGQFIKMRRLLVEEMVSHREIAKGVFVTSYADGSETLVNYTDKHFEYRGAAVAAKDYRLYEPSFWKSIGNLFN